MLAMVRQSGQDGEKEIVTERSSFRCRCIEGESSVVRRQCKWKEKNDEEAKKKRRSGEGGGESMLVAN
jgi:hypothetical protein